MFDWPFRRLSEEQDALVMENSIKDGVHSEKMVLPRPAAAPRHKPSSFSARAPRRSRSFAAVLFIGLFMLWAFGPALRFNTAKDVQRQEHFVLEQEQLTDAKGFKPVTATEKDLVPLEAHIMSKCPDAHDCLIDFIVPAMERAAGMVNWTMSFIGEVTDDDSVRCKHGEEECLGNVMMLCAQKLYPDPKISLGFSTCMIRDYAEIPSRHLVESCALEHAVDFGKLNDCVSEEGEGLSLLKNSVTRSEKLGVKYSCTVRLNDKVRCIRDGGEWVDCDDGSKPGDLIRDIKALYEAS